MPDVNLSIPNDIIFEINSLPDRNKTLHEKLKLRLAIGMFVSQEINLSKAAQLAGQTLSEFMDTLKRLNIPSVSYTDDLLYDDIM